MEEKDKGSSFCFGTQHHDTGESAKKEAGMEQ
jgi:hypothetical protein